MAMEALAQKISARAAGANFADSVRFDCGADGIIVLDGAAARLADEPADCTISLSRDDLEAMIAGELAPSAAFMQGRLKVDGDLAVAMRLSQVL